MLALETAQGIRDKLIDLDTKIFHFNMRWQVGRVESKDERICRLSFAVLFHCHVFYGNCSFTLELFQHHSVVTVAKVTTPNDATAGIERAVWLSSHRDTSEGFQFHH